MPAKRLPTSETACVLGFDGGGTKSICAIADADGAILGVGLSGCTNFQGAGVHAAGEEVRRAIGQALAQARVPTGRIAYAAYGAAGADRDADFDAVADYILPHNPAGRMLLANDTTIALRAGTPDGVGVALICGTGSNCIGFNGVGAQAKVGGLGRFTGDAGSGENVVERAIIAAARGLDGRGPKTVLAERLASALGLAEITDIISLYYLDDYRPPDLGALAPVVFKSAQDGDPVALKLLNRIGDELAENAVAACRRLFARNDPVRIVLGGSILQKARPPIFVERITRGVRAKFPQARITRLKVEPVLGAVYLALDLLHGHAGAARMAKAHRTYASFAVR